VPRHVAATVTGCWAAAVSVGLLLLLHCARVVGVPLKATVHEQDLCRSPQAGFVASPRPSHDPSSDYFTSLIARPGLSGGQPLRAGFVSCASAGKAALVCPRSTNATSQQQKQQSKPDVRRPSQRPKAASGDAGSCISPSCSITMKYRDRAAQGKTDRWIVYALYGGGDLWKIDKPICQ